MNEEAGEDVYTIFQLKSTTSQPLYVTVAVNKAPIRMEIDTVATPTVISETTYQQAWKGRRAPPLQDTKVKLRTYTGQEIPVKGLLQVEVQHGSERKELPLIVTGGQGPSLLGRNWLGELKLDWKAIHQMQESSALATTLDAHKDVFQEGLGMIQGTTAKFQVDPQVPPWFYKPRRVPFSLRQKVEGELERLEKEGIIHPRWFSDWAAPIVPVLKADGSVRICGDYKVTANKAVKVDAYPIP